jgi:hypothetical protein
MIKSKEKHNSQVMDDFKKTTHGSGSALLCPSWVNDSDRDNSICKFAQSKKIFKMLQETFTYNR